MSNLSLKFQCLNLAAQSRKDGDAVSIVKDAQKFLDFILGETESSVTPQVTNHISLEQAAEQKPEDMPEPAKRRGRKPKSETEEVGTETSVAIKSGVTNNTGVVSEFSYDKVRQAVYDLISKAGKQAAVDVLAEFGVSNATQLKKEQWQECYTRMTEELAACG